MAIALGSRHIQGTLSRTVTYFYLYRLSRVVYVLEVTSLESLFLFSWETLLELIKSALKGLAWLGPGDLSGMLA